MKFVDVEIGTMFRYANNVYIRIQGGAVLVGEGLSFAFFEDTVVEILKPKALIFESEGPLVLRSDVGPGQPYLHSGELYCEGVSLQTGELCNRNWKVKPMEVLCL